MRERIDGFGVELGRAGFSAVDLGIRAANSLIRNFPEKNDISDRHVLVIVLILAHNLVPAVAASWQAADMYSRHELSTTKQRVLFS